MVLCNAHAIWQDPGRCNRFLAAPICSRDSRSFDIPPLQQVAAVSGEARPSRPLQAAAAAAIVFPLSPEQEHGEQGGIEDFLARLLEPPGPAVDLALSLGFEAEDVARSWPL